MFIINFPNEIHEFWGTPYFQTNLSLQKMVLRNMGKSVSWGQWEANDSEFKSSPEFPHKT